MPLLVLLALAGLATAGQVLAEGVTNAGGDRRDGWYPEQSSLTPQLVSGGTFGQMWSTNVEGSVYAQPLLSNGTLLIATENNKVYGLDPGNGSVRWSSTLSFGTPWNPADVGCADLTPNIGVTSTPVIDPTTSTAYLTHKTYASGSSGTARWYMDAIDMTNGKEKAGFPVELAGNAQNQPGEAFQPTTELQRPGLLLLNGVVYAAFGSHCDVTPWKGWIFGVSTKGEVKARWVDETSANNGGGIWQSGAGLSSDGPGQILFTTGNGGAPTVAVPGNQPPASLGEAAVRIAVQPDGTLQPVDFFAPFNAPEMDKFDADFASGGLTVLNDQYFGTPALPHLAVAVGKEGYVYLLNRESLGGFRQGTGGADKVVDRIGPYGGVWSRPAVWPGDGGWIYIPTAYSGNGFLRVYKYGKSGTGQPTLALQASSSDAYGFGSSAAVVTSEGTTSGTALVWIVWAPNGGGSGAQLRAYDPIPVEGKPVLRWSAPVGTSSKFAVPGVGAGRIYVGNREGKVMAFGSPVTPPLTGSATSFPTTTQGSSSQKTVTLTATTNLTVNKLTSSSSQFTVGTSTPPLPATLTAGQTIQVPVTFKPTQSGALGATLTAETTAGNTSFSLSGTGQAASAQLTINPVLVAFGGTTVGGELTSTATFSNTGGAPLTINAIKMPAAPFGATGVPEKGSTIEPGGSVNVNVSFKPTSEGTFTSEIAMETTGGNGAVGLSGSAGPPGTLKITSEQTEFGEVQVGKSVTKSFTVENAGGTNVSVTKSKPPSGGAFAATTALSEGTTIKPGETLTETVSFSPTAAGPATGVWLINGNDTTGLHEVKFSGTGTLPPAPANTALPTITGTPQQGQALTAHNGTWTNEPTGFEYEWQRCDNTGAKCAGISGASASTYSVSSGDVGSTLRVAVVASNPGGKSAPASSAQTAVVQMPSATFGKTTVGASTDTFLADRKRVNRYALSGSGSVSKLSIYLAPTGTSGQQLIEGLIYADSSGAPGALLGVSEQLAFQSTNAAGWYDLNFSSPLKLGAGNYWIGIITGASSKVAGFRFDAVTSARDYNANTYASGPTSPFGSPTVDPEQMSLYATYTPPVPISPPANSAPPTITGSAQQGQTLTEHHGTWTNEPTAYKYQWLQCDSLGASCVAIKEATNPTYVPVSGDVGHTVAVEETASNAGGPGTPASSAASAKIVASAPLNSAPPTITGTPQQGQTLTEHHGTWTNEPTAFNYQWLQCDGSGKGCVPIKEATNPTYVPVPGDVGHAIAVEEIASNEGGPGAPATSSATAAVAPPPPPPPVNSAPPTITGTAQQGQTLTEHHGTWSNEPTGYKYQWLQCDSLGASCVAIKEATNPTYTPVSGDVGHTVAVEETASNGSGPGSPATSTATAKIIAAAPVNLAPPTITGTPQQGQTLTEHHGSWSNEPTAYKYQWLQCDGSGKACVGIKEATNPTYVPASGDVGHTIAVEETAGNEGGSSVPARSTATAAVAPPPPPPPANTGVPTITGTPQQGQTLTEHHGTWTNEPTAYKYQWLQCNSLGASCLPIKEATNPTYVPVSGDVGHTIAVEETASNAGGPGSPATSTATAAIQSGTATFGKTTVGASSDSFLANRKRVNRYAMPAAGSVTKLSVYLAPNGKAGQQLIEGLIYSDSSGAPGSLLATSGQFTFKNTNAAGWYDLTFVSPVKLAAGNYWIGVITGATSSIAAFRFDSVTGSRDYNANTYTSGPTSAFGTPTVDAEQMSLYATYTPG